MPVVHTGSTYVGASTSTAHQIWSGGKSGKFGFEAENSTYKLLWTWSGFELDGTLNSVKFTPDPVDGGLQGDFSIGIGSNTSKYPQPVSTFNKTNSIMEVDPAGGTLEFSMVARELSYWHKIGPLLRVTNASQEGNQMNIKEFQTYFHENKSQYNIQEVTFDTNKNSIWYVESTNSYSCEYAFDVWKSDTATTYQPSKKNNKDLTFTCYVGPNNTPYSTYTYVDLLGLVNEISKREYNNTSVVHPHATDFDNKPIGRPAWNVKDKNSTYFDWREGGNVLVTTGIPNQRLISFWQKPNVLYYVHMLWVNPLYTDYNKPPTSNLMTTWTTTWNVEAQDMLLYVEFGISPNGGKDIFWNNATTSGTLGQAIQKVYDRGITATVPTDIHKYITPSIESTSVNRKNVTPYSLSSVSTCSCSSGTPFKFVKIRVNLSSKNDEHNNLIKNRYQQYSIVNYKQLDGNIKTTSALDPNNNGVHYAKYDSSGTTYFQYQIGRKYKTNDWNLQMSASLYYENGSMKYEGNTNIHTK